MEIFRTYTDRELVALIESRPAFLVTGSAEHEVLQRLIAACAWRDRVDSALTTFLMSYEADSDDDAGHVGALLDAFGWTDNQSMPRRFTDVR